MFGMMEDVLACIGFLTVAAGVWFVLVVALERRADRRFWRDQGLE